MQHLKIGVAQIVMQDTLAENRDQIIQFIHRAAAHHCRVVVFPEGALSIVKTQDMSVYDGRTSKADEMEMAKSAIRKAAAETGLYVVYGGVSENPDSGRLYNWMEVDDPSGHRIFGYDKLYDRHNARMPRTFQIDGIRCSAIICADRWLRGVEELPIMEGAKISFELSNNYGVEWIPKLKWYWYVPRAIRNNVFVIFSNTAGRGAHGHSAIIAPDGRFMATARGNVGQLVTANIDVGEATRTEAIRRFEDPVFHSYWRLGLEVRDGDPVSVRPLHPLVSPRIDIKVAAAQIACSRSLSHNVAEMETMIREASSHGADVVVFPALSVTGALEDDIQKASVESLDSALKRIELAARQAGIYVVFGMPHISTDGDRNNSAYVVGSDGTLLTRYDQIAVRRPQIFQPGTNPGSMWFRLKGVPCVVTVGKDALWTEIAEMAAVAGAQMHFNISYDLETGRIARQRRLQVWANMASYLTFSPTVNAASPAGLKSPSAPADGASAIWSDLNSSTKTHLAKEGRKADNWKQVAIYSPWSANCIVRAGNGEQLLYATRRVNARNPYDQEHFNPRMIPWYSYGAWLITRKAGNIPSGMARADW